jgi:miniconductance mechanosensitive channel
MTIANLEIWAAQNTQLAVIVVILLCAILFFFFHSIIGRGLYTIASRSSTKIDDIIINHLKPFRTAWLAPLVGIYAVAFLFPTYQDVIEKTSLVLITWLTAVTINSLLNAVNDIYESGKNYNGISIQGYLDLVKIVIVLVAIILSVTLITGESPWVLLTGLGALTAVLLLIFQGTILSLVASIQIVANDLLKEGDWIEVPSYEADGDVVNINLHTVKIRNFDMTYTIIPTYKLVEVAYKNWRGMKESGGRRIQRSLNLDMISIKFCDPDMIDRLRKIDLINEYVDNKFIQVMQFREDHKSFIDSPLDGPQITNIELFREYISAYLRNRSDVHQNGMPFVIRALSPTPNGLPVEIYVFIKSTEWEEFEKIQSEIFDHLLASIPYFELRVFQQPTGLDFSSAFNQGKG